MSNKRVRSFINLKPDEYHPLRDIIKWLNSDIVLDNKITIRTTCNSNVSGFQGYSYQHDLLLEDYLDASIYFTYNLRTHMYYINRRANGNEGYFCVSLKEYKEPNVCLAKTRKDDTCATVGKKKNICKLCKHCHTVCYHDDLLIKFKFNEEALS